MHMLKLPAVCDRGAAAALYAELRAAVHDGAVEIDGSAVARCGQAMVQLLVAARTTTERTGNAFRLTASAALTETLLLTGFGTLASTSNQI